MTAAAAPLRLCEREAVSTARARWEVPYNVSHSRFRRSSGRCLIAASDSACGVPTNYCHRPGHYPTIVGACDCEAGNEQQEADQIGDSSNVDLPDVEVQHFGHTEGYQTGFNQCCDPP